MPTNHAEPCWHGTVESAVPARLGTVWFQVYAPNRKLLMGKPRSPEVGYLNQEEVTF